MIVTAEKFNELKKRIKIECQRRCRKESVASYGEIDYDYSHIPKETESIRKEHYEKLTIPINAINNSFQNLYPLSKIIIDNKSINEIETRIEQYEKTAMQEENYSDCNNSCAGLCYTGCWNECKDACTSACASGCGGSCSNSCSGSCSGRCTGDCSAACADACYAQDCSGGCGGKCSGGCGDGCTTACTADGCGSSCWNGCSDSCQGSCNTQCFGTCLGSGR